MQSFLVFARQYYFRILGKVVTILVFHYGLALTIQPGLSQMKEAPLRRKAMSTGCPSSHQKRVLFKLIYIFNTDSSWLVGLGNHIVDYNLPY